MSGSYKLGCVDGLAPFYQPTIVPRTAAERRIC